MSNKGIKKTHQDVLVDSHRHETAIRHHAQAFNYVHYAAITRIVAFIAFLGFGMYGLSERQMDILGVSIAIFFFIFVPASIMISRHSTDMV